MSTRWCRVIFTASSKNTSYAHTACISEVLKTRAHTNNTHASAQLKRSRCLCTHFPSLFIFLIFFLLFFSPRRLNAVALTLVDKALERVVNTEHLANITAADLMAISEVRNYCVHVNGCACVCGVRAYHMCALVWACIFARAISLTAPPLPWP